MAKLTEQDIISWKGSEDDYMNADQLEFFRERLLQMKEELVINATQTTNHLQEQEATPDPADRATLEEEYALELRTRDRERKLIKKIEKTMKLIDDGDFGYCDTCGIEIGIRRLEARPTADQCIDCKTLAEIKEKQLAG